MASSEDVVVREGDAPLLTFRGRVRDDQGNLSAYVFPPGATVTFIIKASPDDPDSSAVQTVGGTITLDGTTTAYSECTFQMSPIATPKNYYYRLYATKSGNKETLRSGFYVVENV